MPGRFTFFCEQIDNNIAKFDTVEYGHAVRTLRYKIGDIIEFTDGKGNSYKGIIDLVEKATFWAKILNRQTAESVPLLNIYCGIIKSTDRMEWMVEKCTELGMQSLCFIKTQKSEREGLKIEKLRKVAIAAMKQSHRNWLPEIKEMRWKEFLIQEHEVKLIALIPALLHAQQQPFIQKSTAILIGPEGDFSEIEKKQALDHGYHPIALSNSVLRTETAAVTAAAWYGLGAI